ncbi:MAG: alpha-L-fucosidase [Verrucomicrobia bacterium]|nr:alpha-L-fucosidase [Verrucomicrobiota bacterium]
MKMKNTRPTLAIVAMSLSLFCFGCADQAANGTKATPPAGAAQTAAAPASTDRFQPTLDSLKQYECPDWFRDAKFGIWAHWGPQAVPMDGDWYARGMYEPGNKHYKYHLEHYGHPSEFGYKDIIPLWKAEKWNPDRLMALYKKAGAKYFVSMGTHHDNFFLWKSKLHKWNAANMGPKRDVVADWQKAAKKHGLRFGVSEHLGASFTWFQSSHRADKEGPKAGVPYDGANPKWWDLYHFPAEPDDKAWYSTNPKWQQQWTAAIRELVDNYKPDLLYTDGVVPFGTNHIVGLTMIARLYNSNAARNKGKVDVVYNCKQKSDGRWVEDLERGIMPKIEPYPWQTDTSIGDWYYNRNWKFRPLSWVVHMLVDNVSKNGNLLLNVVQRPDGSLDAEVEQMLEQLAGWTAIHGEAIFGSRPWLVYGEGPVRARGGHFKEDFKYSSKDIRFTTKGATLYALALAWPQDGRITIRSLAKPAGPTVAITSGGGATVTAVVDLGNNITSVSLLGSYATLAWKQTADGLVVTLPAQKVSELTVGLKITGTDLKPVPFVQEFEPIRADDKGNFSLRADDADLHGSRIKQETKGVHTNIGFWDNASEWVSWKVKFDAPGKFKVSAQYATTHDGAEFAVELAGKRLNGKAPKTAGWDDFKGTGLGTIEITKPGEQLVTVRAKDPATWKAINLRAVRLQKM